MHILCEHSIKSIKGFHLQCVFRALSSIANVEHLNEMTMILSELSSAHMELTLSNVKLIVIKAIGSHILAKSKK